MQFRNPFTARRRTEEQATSPYTTELVHLLAARFGTTPGEQGAYIGAASTRLARLFLQHGHTLVATASRPEGRVELETLQRDWPAFRVIDGSPEITNLPSASVDFILSERVLHLPNLLAIQSEFRRILRPGGVVMLITDNRVYGGSTQAEDFEDLLRTHCKDFREKAAPAGISGKLASFFPDGEVFEDAFIGRQCLTLPALRDQVCKLPIFPTESEPEHAAANAALVSFFSRWSANGVVSVPMVCRVACARLGQASSSAQHREPQLVAHT